MLRFLFHVLLSGLFIAAVYGEGSAVSKRSFRAELDLAKRNAAISPYIYGQFIEHLGRCIYGGLWAEMLEDRKFFYPVTGRAPVWTLFQPGSSSWEGEGHPYELLTRSPWLVIGDLRNVEMDSIDPYVGEHSPRISAQSTERAGLYQERLHLQAGREYTGRIVFRTGAARNPVSVTLVWGHGFGDRLAISLQNPDMEYHTRHFRFTSGRTTDNGRLEITTSEGDLWIGAVSLMPADNLYGWRSDTVALLKQLNSPVYRWPGGNFVSGYNWKDGIGDPDRRPSRKNPAWKGVEPNDVGLHEYLKLCGIIGAEPFIAVNTGLGGPDLAAEQVEYVNGAPETPMGKTRVQNGRKEPWGVRFWSVGNEMYGDWQLGHMPLKKYVLKHIRVADAMRFKDPSIQLIGVGAVGEWSRTMLEKCAGHMEMISEHLYWQDRENLAEHVRQIPQGIRRVAEAHRGYRQTLPSPQSRYIPIALDEWNYWYGANEFGELGVRYFLQDALGIAAGLHEMIRQSDLFGMANYAQTVNVIGAIKTTPTRAEFETTGLVLKMYRNHFGEIPVAISNPDLDSQTPLDLSAAVSKNGATLTIGVVNASDTLFDLELRLNGGSLAGTGREYVVSGDDRRAHNDPDVPRRVDIVERSLSAVAGRLTVQPLSVTLFKLDLRP